MLSGDAPPGVPQQIPNGGIAITLISGNAAERPSKIVRTGIVEASGIENRGNSFFEVRTALVGAIWKNPFVRIPGNRLQCFLRGRSNRAN